MGKCNVKKGTENEECVDCHKLNKIINGNNEKDAFRKDSTQVQDPSTQSRGQSDNIDVQEKQKLDTVEEERIQEEVSQSSTGPSGDELALTVRAGSKGRLRRNDSSDVDSETVSVRNKSSKPSNKNQNELKSRKRNPPRTSSTALRNIKDFDDSQSKILMNNSVPPEGQINLLRSQSIRLLVYLSVGNVKNYCGGRTKKKCSRKECRNSHQQQNKIFLGGKSWSLVAMCLMRLVLQLILRINGGIFWQDRVRHIMLLNIEIQMHSFKCVVIGIGFDNRKW